MGASNSSRMGWLIKISLAFVHRYFISYSCSWTGLPGRFPRTVTWSEEVGGGVGGRVERQLTFKKTVNDRVEIDFCGRVRHCHVFLDGLVNEYVSSRVVRSLEETGVGARKRGEIGAE